MRGMEIQAVGIASVSYDEKSTELINMRNEGAMLSDPTVREGYMQGHVARGLEAAGSNSAGAMAGFMGMGMGMNAMGSAMGAASAANMQQMQMQQNAAMQQQNAAMQQQNAAMQNNANTAGQKPANMGAVQQGQSASQGWTCACGAENSGKFCSECGNPKPLEPETWTCACGQVNSGRFCSECGKPKPENNGAWICACGQENSGKFCSQCGKPRQ